MKNRYIVSIDNDALEIHTITIIDALTEEDAREIATKEAPNSIIGVFEKFPTLLIEDGINYVLSAWKPLKCALTVARQREKVIALQNELGREQEKLRDFEGALQKARDEMGMVIPRF